MKLIILPLFAVFALYAAAHSHPRCHTGFKTLYETIYGYKCRTYFDTQCHVEHKIEYKTDYKQDCHTYYVQDCEKYYDTISHVNANHPGR